MKTNKSQLARDLEVNPRTIQKYLESMILCSSPTTILSKLGRNLKLFCEKQKTTLANLMQTEPFFV